MITEQIKSVGLRITRKPFSWYKDLWFEASNNLLIKLIVNKVSQRKQNMKNWSGKYQYADLVKKW